MNKPHTSVLCLGFNIPLWHWSGSSPSSLLWTMCSVIHSTSFMYCFYLYIVMRIILFPDFILKFPKARAVLFPMILRRELSKSSVCLKTFIPLMCFQNKYAVLTRFSSVINDTSLLVFLCLTKKTCSSCTPFGCSFSNQ